MDDGTISIHGPTVHGTYNLLGTSDGEFILQGNLDEDQCDELRKKLDELLGYEAR